MSEEPRIVIRCREQSPERIRQEFAGQRICRELLSLGREQQRRVEPLVAELVGARRDALSHGDLALLLGDLALLLGDLALLPRDQGESYDERKRSNEADHGPARTRGLLLLLSRPCTLTGQFVAPGFLLGIVSFLLCLAFL